ncbi:MAG: phosphate uptake regulator PhoU [Nanoarchaeota archaeon]|nr:phosphate uptake regulator PhoU [Nanoarchaeota archaeon]
MESRKVIGFGKNSLAITLPKSWSTKHSVQKGDTVEVDEDNHTLTIAPQHTSAPKKAKSITITIDKKNPEKVKSQIFTAYLQNYSTIRIVSKSVITDARAIITEILSLSGMEILEQTAKKIIAKDLMDINEVSIKKIVRRIDIITRSMIEDTLTCLSLEGENKESEQKELVTNIHTRDTDVNRLHFLAYRVVRGAMQNPAYQTKIQMSPVDLQDHRSLTIRIERIADQAKRIANDLLNILLVGKPKRILGELFQVIQQRYLDAMKSYYNTNKEIALEIEVTTKKLLIELDNGFETYIDQYLKGETKEIKPKSFIIESRIVESMKIMTRETRNIARIVLGTDTEQKL